jgi:hypothetical protein
MMSHTLDLCDKRMHFIQSYDHLYAYRTGKMVDRRMKVLDRACLNDQYFRGTFESADSRVRVWGAAMELLSLVSRYGEEVR